MGKKGHFMRAKARPKSAPIIERALKKGFPFYPAEYPPRALQEGEFTVFVRVVSDRFKGKDRCERDDMVHPIIKKLPRDVSDDLMILLLLTPDELQDSLVNREFFEPKKVNKKKKKPSAA
jgi:hypothetical protein